VIVSGTVVVVSDTVNGPSAGSGSISAGNDVMNGIAGSGSGSTTAVVVAGSADVPTP
jgi:hypothetical protein